MKKYAGCLFALWLSLAGQAWALDLQRPDYTVKLPDQSTIDPEDGPMDLAHYTTVNLPHDSTLFLLVNEDKSQLNESLDAMSESLTHDMPDAKIEPGNMLKKFDSESRRFVGTLAGEKIVYEVGGFSGRKKGYIIMFAYPETQATDAQAMLRDIVGSFKSKQ